jgi:hypothetical protein
MPEARQIIFSYQELAEALVKQQDIREGLWGLYVEFNITAANITGPEGIFIPAAIVPVQRLGIQRFDAEVEGLTVDAAVVNPASE